MTETIDLRQPEDDLRKAKVGTIVITSKGFEFKLMSRKAGKECWLDCTSKVIWHDREDKTYTHFEAVEKFGDALPTIEEFKKAKKHGFLEILPDMDYWFWSSSLYPDQKGKSKAQQIQNCQQQKQWNKLYECKRSKVCGL